MKIGSKLLLAFAVTVLGALSVGCSNPCDDLKTDCTKCTTSAQSVDQLACNLVVQENNSDACKQEQGPITSACP